MVWFVWFDSCTRRPFRKTMLQRYAEAKQEYFSKNHWTEFFGPTSLLQIGLCLVSRGTIWRSCCSLQFGGILVLFIVIRKLKKKIHTFSQWSWHTAVDCVNWRGTCQAYKETTCNACDSPCSVPSRIKNHDSVGSPLELIR